MLNSSNRISKAESSNAQTRASPRSQRPLKCRFCWVCFKYEQTLLDHIQRTHVDAIKVLLYHKYLLALNLQQNAAKLLAADTDASTDEAAVVNALPDQKPTTAELEEHAVMTIDNDSQSDSDELVIKQEPEFGNQVSVIRSVSDI